MSMARELAWATDFIFAFEKAQEELKLVIKAIDNRGIMIINNSCLFYI